MNKHTEDETFELLKRSKFETVLAEIQHAFDTRLFTNIDYRPLDIIQKHGWTEQDYLIALSYLHIPT